MKIKKLLRLFDQWCLEHRSENTARHYQGRLKTFKKRFGNRKVCNLKPLEIEEWLRDAARWPDGKFKAPDTRRSNVIAFQRFQSWLIEFGELDEPILSNIEKPPSRQRTRIPTAEETAAILTHSSLEFRRTYQALRRTGCRPGELSRLEIQHWDRENDLLILQKHKTARKTGKPRVIAVGEKLKPLLIEAIGDREAGAIFLSPNGSPWTTQLLSQTFRRIRLKADLPLDLVLYLTRHEHASQLCEKLGIHAAAEALGHVNLQTTKRYVKTDPAALRRNQDAFED